MITINSAGWMSLIPDEANIKSINLPGAHDASTKYCQFGLFSRCQKLNIKEMLEIGVRVFDLRVNGEYMVHSFTKCKKSAFGKALTIFDVIGDISDFLSCNPSETVLIFLKNDGKISGKDCLDMFREKIINKNKNIWYLKNQFPCLSQARGKIVLLNRIDKSIGIDFSKMPYQGGSSNPNVEDFSPNKTDKVSVQDWYLLPRKRKWYEAAEPLFNNEKNYRYDLILNYLSCAGFPFIPLFNAAYVNKKFLEYNLKFKGSYGIIMADFLNKEITEKIIKTNFNNKF